MQSFKTIDFGLQQNQNCYYFIIIICLCCATAQLNDVSLNACNHYECSGNNLFHVAWVSLMSVYYTLNVYLKVTNVMSENYSALTNIVHNTCI